MNNSEYAVYPGQGWGNIQLGQTISEIRAELDASGYTYELSEDELLLDILTPEITCYFDDSSNKVLKQIVFYDSGHHVLGQPVIGLTLAEALLPFELKNYSNTIWSLVSIEEEFPQGKPLPDSKRIQQSSTEEKLECGTLWLQGQGVGLVMLFEQVHALAIRQPGSEPKIGCGQLDSQTMSLALASGDNQEDGTKKADSFSGQSLPSKNRKAFGSLSGVLRRIVFTLLAVTFLVVPALILYRDLTAWNDALTVTGRVVATKPERTPENPFIDEVVVAYSIPNSGEHRIDIPSAYTTAFEVDQEVELVYLPNQPGRAMTRLQSKDEGLTVSPYLLFISIAISTLMLHLAFPEQIRFGSRRPSQT